ncbi:MAG: phytanoyl-CoA dioxygenase family protein [Robiginitomaculum sp.]|nr:phytanoyl-CoA dioxygenase family protein [Robiginitomaculum sp.]MDQ7077576.1 phytanoyl-CoA dioxygenase family protein [Robiginitomaculum sp.]
MILPPSHKLNTGFSWRTRPVENLRHLDSAVVNDFNEKGYALVPDAVPADQLDILISAIDLLEGREEETVLTFDSGEAVVFGIDQMTFACNLAAQSEVLRAFSSGPLMRDLMHDLIGPDVRMYWDQAVYKKPRHVADFAWHQDNGYTFTEPQDYVTCWLALTDADASNGCPWVLPGLHRNGTFAHDQSEEGLVISGLDHDSIVDRAICTPAKAGDMVIFSSLTPHMTGPNLTSETRKAYILQYMSDGAVRVHDDGTREALNNATNNFYILRDGKAV